MRKLKRLLLLIVCIVLGGIGLGEVTPDLHAATTTISLAQVKKIAYRRYELQDGNGKTYDVYIYSDSGKKQKATWDNGLVWAGAGEGDLLVTGKFKFAYGLQGSTTLNIYTLPELPGEQTLNLTRPYLKTIHSIESGISDFATVFIPECSAGGELYCYAIINGKLKPVTFQDDEGKSEYIWVMGGPNYFQPLGTGQFRSIEFYNVGDYAYGLFTWEYNKANNTMNYLDFEESINAPY